MEAARCVGNSRPPHDALLPRPQHARGRAGPGLGQRRLGDHADRRPLTSSAPASRCRPRSGARWSAIGAPMMITGEWWAAFFPGMAIAMCVLSFAVVGEAIRILVNPERRALTWTSCADQPRRLPTAAPGTAGSEIAARGRRPARPFLHLRRRRQGAERVRASRCSRGEMSALVGESGRRQVGAAWALLGLTRRPGNRRRARSAGTARRVLQMGQRRLQALRGREIGLIVANPRSHLHPLKKVGRPDRSGLRGRQQASRAKRRARRCSTTLKAVEMPGSGARLQLLSARAQRRHGAARPDRDGADQPPGAGDRRRRHQRRSTSPSSARCST